MLGTVDTPVPKADELLVKVHSFALNRMDVLQRQGGYPAPFGASQILGVEFSGVVESVGASVSTYKKGDRVFGLVYGGAYAEFVVINEKMAMKIPEGMSFEDAAALPEVWFTAYQALHLNCGLQEHESVLIHAGASGVGTAAIQLAKLANAKHIIVTNSSEEKAKFCLELGATHAINYKQENFKEKVLEYTGNRGVDVIVDFVGSSHWDNNLASLAMDGRMVMLAFLSGAVVKETNLGPILRKRLT
ncbi:hypothetical protein HDU76_009961, partial [Blyttiomyces sp. JEL0837]